MRPSTLTPANRPHRNGDLGENPRSPAPPPRTRHTYASMMLSAGELPMWAAQQMGHSDSTMIVRFYGRWIPEAGPDAGITDANTGKSTPA
jgi:integrase